MNKRLIVGISGASCAALAVTLLEAMQHVQGWETHAVISAGAHATILQETTFTPDQVANMATTAYSPHNLSAAIASGTFCSHGMVIVPCSMKTLAGVATGYSDTLLLRAADVTLKERKRLVLVTRETPLSALHLQNMLAVTQLGGIILPPMLSMYTPHTDISAQLHHITGKILQLFDIPLPNFFQWGESPKPL